jgi:hypothetical protein
MPRSRTPVVSRPAPPPRRLRYCLPRKRARRPYHDYNPISGLHSAAYLLAPPGSAPRIAPTHARFATGPPAGFGRVGLAAAIPGRAPTGKHWRVSCNAPIPSPRASLGATPVGSGPAGCLRTLPGRLAVWREGCVPSLSGGDATAGQAGLGGRRARENNLGQYRFSPLHPRPHDVPWVGSTVAHEGFGSCASAASEPRQARKGAAIRYAGRVPQIHRNPS